MSKLVEELREIVQRAYVTPGGETFSVPIRDVIGLLAHIERLNEEVASWQRVHRAEYEKREALDAHIERLEAALQMIANCGLDAGQCRQVAESGLISTQQADNG